MAAQEAPAGPGRAERRTERWGEKRRGNEEAGGNPVVAAPAAPETAPEATPVEIDRIIGIGVGLIGLSLSDAYRLTLEEFNILYEEWDRYRTAAYRTSWEQTRFIAQCALLPYAKRSFRPTDLIAFDWERSPLEEIRPASREDFERMRERFEGA